MGHSGNWYPVGPVKWDAQGNPYQDTSDGQKNYIPPIAAAQYQDDPKMLAWAKAHGANVTYGAKDANGNPTVTNVKTGAPEGGYMHGQPYWNSEKGEWEYPNFFDTPLGGTVLGASAVAAPIAISSLYGGAAAPTIEASMNAGVGATVAPATAGATAGGAAAGGAAGGAAAAKGASVGSNIWDQVWKELVGQGINAGLNIWGAKQSADASTEAARIQSEAALKAAMLAREAQDNTLAFQKSQWDTTQANMAPWLRTGQSAIRTLGDLMGLSSSGSGAVPIRRNAPMMPPTSMNTLYPSTDGGGQPPAASGQTTKTPDYVRISWPDGHQDTVRSNALNQYQLLGAQVVG